MQDKARGDGRMQGGAVAFPECEVINWCHPITQPSRCTAPSRVEPEWSVFLERR